MKKAIMLLMLICVSITVCAQTEKGIEILRRAEAGDANAQFELSECFEYGSEDFPESKRDYVKWLKRAAENGHAKAQYYLADYYYDKKKHKKYLKWLALSANNGYESAMYELALCCNRKSDAIYWLKRCMDTCFKMYGEKYDLTSRAFGEANTQVWFCYNASEEMLREEYGILYNPRTKLYSQVSNSSNRSTNSSSVAPKSSSSVNKDLLYEGMYTVSGQGYCAEMGTYINGGDLSTRIKIYNDHIVVGGEWHDYVETSGGWRIYKGSTNFGATPFYKVNPKTFEMSKYMVMYNQFTGGTNRVTYAMAKGDVTFNKYSNNSGGYYGNSGSVSGANTHSGSAIRQQTTRDKKECGACGGKGWIPSTRGVASFGQEKWCSECNKKVPSSHYHETCPSCKGEGKW